jgi:hypothetical protein
MYAENHNQDMVDWGAPAAEASDKRLLYEVALGLLVVTGPGLQLIDDRTVSWTWFVFGALSIALAFGVGRTSFGRQVDTWFERIGIGGRLVAISTAAVVIWGAIWMFEPPVVLTSSFVVGAVVVLIAVPAFRLVKRIGIDRRTRPT